MRLALVCYSVSNSVAVPPIPDTKHSHRKERITKKIFWARIAVSSKFSCTQ